ncbi:IDEAL domain-containing protein [Paraliobacillus salinarum]|uniref:IDEAL domain-containing protein n=1 Tax=Paraliobacillus salinarum TaxID=1158996 RepID=UPI0015F65E9C|nr:IDEAL domain-containing protein [Paraliobacillus salinarum]
MFSVHMFQPYYVKEESDRIRIVLAYQYFSLEFEGKVYQFVPLEARKIEINRKTLQVINQNEFFIFQNEKNFKSITLDHLLEIPSFRKRLKEIVDPYVNEVVNPFSYNEINEVIVSLEKKNMKRLIDQALDKKDISEFMKYSTQLNSM